MSDLIQAVKGTALSVAEYFTPVLKQSKFKQTGVITPEEFVIAGDHLVHQCPTWSWNSATDPSLIKSYLPADKQYLVTKKVPCYKRCKDIEYCNNDEKVIMTENDEEGWVDTHHSEPVAVVNEMIDDMTISEEPQAQQSQHTLAQYRVEEDEDDEAEDMDQFMNMVEEHDTSAAPTRSSTNQHKQAAVSDNNPSKDSGDQNVESSKDNIVATRTYDLYITYDKYYQTPRLWLVGYGENLKPLTINEMYQDISQDHAKKTVTMETHPHIPTVMASVHPCRHAEVMKKIISTVEDGDSNYNPISYHRRQIWSLKLLSKHWTLRIINLMLMMIGLFINSKSILNQLLMCLPTNSDSYFVDVFYKTIKKLIEYDCSGKVIHLVRRPPPTLDSPNQESFNADPNDNNNNYRDVPTDNNRFLDESNVLLSAMTLGTEANMNPILRHFLTIQQAIYSRFRADGTTPASTSIEPLSMTDIDRHLHNAARLLRITVTTVNECMARIASLPSNGTRPNPESESMTARRVITTASSHTDLQRDDEMQTSHANSENQSSNAPEETVDDIALGATAPSCPRRNLRSSTTRQSLTTDDLPPPANRTIQRLVPVAVTRSRNGSGPPLTPRQRGESELDRYLSILNYSCDLQNQFQGLARRYRQLTDMSRRGGLIIPQTSASASTTTTTEQVNLSSNDQPTRQPAQYAQTSSTLMNEARILGMYIPRIMHHIGHLQHALSDFSVDFTRGRLLLCVATNARNGQRSASRANASAQNTSAPQSASDESNSTSNTFSPSVLSHIQSHSNQGNQSRDPSQSNPILEGTVTITGTTIEAGPMNTQPQANATIVLTSESANGLHIPVSIPLSLGAHGSISMDFVTAPDLSIPRRSGGASPSINVQPGNETTHQDTTLNSRQSPHRPIGVISGRIPLPFDYYLPCFSPWANYTVTNRPVARRVVRDAFVRWRATRDTGAESNPLNNPNSVTANNNNINSSDPVPPQAGRDIPAGSPNMDMGLTEVVSNIVGSIFRMPQQNAQQVGSAGNTNPEPLLNIIPELALNAASQILGGVLGIPTSNQTSQNQQGARPQQSSTTSSATVMMDIDIDDSSSSQSESRYQDARDSQSPSTLQSGARPTNSSTQAFIPQPVRPQGSSSSNMSTRYNRQQLVEVMQNHPDWIPIIEADIGVMEQQQIANGNGQPFFSDAYLSSIPRKRRRLLASNSNQVLILQPSPSHAIANLLRRAISSSSSPNTESLDQILGTISNDQNLQNAYEDYIKTAVEARLKSDYDYCPEKFENSSKYFK